MRLTTLLFTIVLIHAHTDSSAQHVTLSGKELSFAQVFSTIKKQTGYLSVYNKGLFSGGKKLSFTVNNMPLQDFLDLLIKDQPVSYYIERKTIFFSRKASRAAVVANQAPIRVRVVDSLGNLLAGASVLIKNNKSSGITDAGGMLNLNVAEGDVLLVSFIGMESRSMIITSSILKNATLTVSLRSSIANLADVEVVYSTGYQQLPRERATGSFEFISKQQLNQRSGPDILSRLDGISPSIVFDRRGLDANASPDQINPGLITIRGISTLGDQGLGVSPPLIVLNNFPYDGNINNINPNDVESVTILKDAAAASIYGARAANGVIVITTKQGKLNQPARWSVNSNITVTEKPDLFFLPQMSSSDFIDVERFLFQQGFYDNTINNTWAPGLSPVIEILDKERRGLISAADATRQIDALRTIDVRNDFDRYIYRTAVSQQYSIGLSGGSDKVKYAASGGFDRNLTNLTGNQMNRVTFRSDNTFMPAKNLELTIGLGYTSSNTQNNSLGNIGTAAYQYRDMIMGEPQQSLYPYARFADDNGNSLTLPRNWREGYTDTAGGGKLLDWKYRPLEELKLKDETVKLQDVLLNFSAKYRIDRSFSVDIRYQFQKSNLQFRNLYREKSYYARNSINLFSQIDGNTVTYILPKGGILQQTDNQVLSHAGNVQLNFDRTWNGSHNLVAMGGAEVRQSGSVSNSLTYYGYNENIHSIASVDFAHFYPWYGDRGGFKIPDGINMTSLMDRFVSFFGNAAYSYDNRYTFSISGRRDAANLFGVDINNKWKPLWSVGGAWNISNEPFYNLKSVPFLMVRASYGYQGNVNNKVSPYAVLQHQEGLGTIIDLPFAEILQPGNPSLSWETINQLNIGIDFRAVNNRLSGKLEIFRKRTKNLLAPSPVDPTTGVGSVTRNIAGLVDRGIELSLNAKVGNETFKWSPSLLFTYVTTKITEWAFETRSSFASGYINDGKHLTARKGEPPYTIYSLPFAGLDPATGDPLGFLGKQVSKDYKAILYQIRDTANIIYHGSAIPPYVGTLTNSFSYKGISLMMAVSYRLGYYFRKGTISYRTLFTLGATHADFSKRWKKPGDEAFTTIPSMVYPFDPENNRDEFYQMSSVNVLRGDHIRLEYINLSYNFNASLLERAGINDLQLYAKASNLGLLWRANKEKIDPDYNTGRYFPVPRNLTLGLQVTF